MRQKSYDTAVRNRNGQENDAAFWTQNYLLGLTSEIDEVLREINWKRHRKITHHEVNRRNLAFELADLTKYVLAMWEVWGFTLEELLDTVDEKGIQMERLWQQETADEPYNKKVIVCDLDGTLANWRISFVHWLYNNYGVNPVDDMQTLLMDTDLNLDYPTYNRYKEEFESGGGYRYLEPFKDGVDLLKQLMEAEPDIYLIVYTARPNDRHKHIWMDSYLWLREQGIEPNQLHIGGDPRILSAKKLQLTNQVILLDDDPNLILRASYTGLRVYARQTRYNEHLVQRHLKGVTWVKDFSELSGKQILQGV